MRLRHYFLLFFLVTCICKPVAAVEAGEIRILFIGNSLTYTNDLPALVQELADRDGKTISYKSLLLPDYSLEDHWNSGTAEAEIGQGNYDFVVAQQGPSALPGSQALLLEYAGRFARVCREKGSTLVLYMVWPSKARSFDLDNVIYSYTNAAKKTGSLLCPAGLAWKNAWEDDPSFSLYGADDFHPGIKGSVLAALTLYGVLANKTELDFMRGNTFSWNDRIGEKEMSGLKTAALKAIH